MTRKVMRLSTFLTQYKNGESEWEGPRIQAADFDSAERKAETYQKWNKTFRVIGELEGEYDL